MADPTVDPALRSFVDVPPGSDFPIQNLPLGVVRPAGGGPARACVRIGDAVLDLAAAAGRGLLDGCGLPPGTFEADALNPFLALGRPAWEAVRARVSSLLSAGNATLRDDPESRARCLLPLAGLEALLPARIGDYTDFYSSREHASTVGAMFRGPDNALMPNWLHLPVAYHGRASSVVVSGTPVRRPRGQSAPAAPGGPPAFGPSRRLDYELEVGFLVGPGNRLGEAVPVAQAGDHVFGLVLVNDWSARDLQQWEYQPLGPFTSKNFATTVSPWVVPLQALAPFRCDPPPQDPAPLPYLGARGRDAYDLHLRVEVRPWGAAAGAVTTRSNHRHLYWSLAQQVAHHTVTGCDLRPGDLLASGTVSAPGPEGGGSLLERTRNGAEPLPMPDGSTRAWLQDGDTVVLTGWCQSGDVRVGFGEAVGRILPCP